MTQPNITNLDFLEYPQLKSLVFKRLIGTSGSFNLLNFYSSFGKYIAELGIVENPWTLQNQISTYELHDSDKCRIREIIWDYVIERVLTIGDNGSGTPDASWYRLTEYGESLKKSFADDSSTVIPNDPFGYIERLKKEVPQVDEVIVEYLSESLITYRINQLLSATIALGCASEKALLLLIDKYVETFNDDSRREDFIKKISIRNINCKYELFKKSYDALPKEIKVDGGDAIMAFFNLVRRNRNDAGHPNGVKIDKSELYAHLQVFIYYLTSVYEQMDLFEEGH